MEVVVSTRGTRRWLSGVFLTRASAETCLAGLPKKTTTLHVIESLPIATFPLFIIEDRSGFTFLDPLAAAQAVDALPPPPVDGEPILFAVLSEFRPEVDGRDEMGRLRHVHLDESHLIDLRRSGLSALVE